jgi:serine/threonine protein kinase
VYGLGLLLYEMLAGHPAFHFAQRRDDAILQEVVAGLPEPLNRTDLAEDIQNIVQLAVERAPERRQQDVRVFAKMLRTKFGEVPAEKRRSYNRVILTVVLLVALATIILIMLSALFG